MIRWIRERLGTAPHDALGETGYAIVDVRHLVDKGGNPAPAIVALVDRGLNAYRAGATVVVACDFGVSRSNAIAAGILSAIESLPFETALAQVAVATGETEIKLEVASDVRDALEGGAPAGARDRGTVLVTGGSGFVGGALVASLEKQARVVSPSRAQLDVGASAVSLDAYCRRENVGQIVHLAYPRVYTNADAAGASVTMLRNVLDVCRVRGVRLIFVSGWVVFSGYASAAKSVDEETPMSPKGVYGETKYLEESLVQLYARRGDVESVTCRLGPVYGPGSVRPRLIRTFFKNILRGDTIVTHRFKNGLPALELLYVDDAVEALRCAVQTPCDGIFHFGSGQLKTTLELSNLIGEIAGKPFERDEIAIDDFTSNISLDSRKAAARLGWKARVPVEEGLRRTLAP